MKTPSSSHAWGSSLTNNPSRTRRVSAPGLGRSPVHVSSSTCHFLSRLDSEPRETPGLIGWQVAEIDRSFAGRLVATSATGLIKAVADSFRPADQSLLRGGQRDTMADMKSGAQERLNIFSWIQCQAPATYRGIFRSRHRGVAR